MSKCYIVAAHFMIWCMHWLQTLVNIITHTLYLQAIILKLNPLYLTYPTAIATSFAFMLPVATPPNAVVFSYGYVRVIDMVSLTLNAPIATKVICFSRLLKCLRSLYCKQSGPRSDCSYRSSLFWAQAVSFFT